MMRWFDKIAAAVVGVTGLVAFGFWDVSAIRAANFPDRHLPQIAVLASEKAFPVGFEAIARSYVDSDPLDQAYYNAFYTDRAVRQPGKVGTREDVAVLADLGWRSTGAQMNLLYAAAIANDYRELLRRSDALLRRGIANAEIMNVLYVVEQQPKMQTALARRLSENPEWRHAFFVNDRGYGSAAAVAARLRTIRMLERMGSPIRTGEVAPMVANMVDRSLVRPAYMVWRHVTDDSSRPTRGMLLDPTFERAARQPWRVGEEAEGNAARSSPFAWRLGSGPGFDAVADMAGATATLHLRWDGNGVPLLASQRFRSAGVPVELRLTGPDAQPQLLSRLSLVMMCGDQRVEFDHIVPTQGNELKIAASKKPDCAFPDFRILPRIGEADIGGFEISLTSANILPKKTN